MKKKILIVDDAAFMRIKIRKILTSLNCEFLEAANGAEGCEQYETASPDLVLLDISMPVMNGLDALKKMVELDSTIPIIMCSAIGQESQMVQAIHCGAKEFIVKPFTDDQIFKIVQKFLND